MNKLKLDFENCYWIKKLDYEFDFLKLNSYSIYAPNLVMKTSFSKTFIDFINWQNTSDLAFPSRETKRLITDESWSNIPQDTVFVIEQYKDYNSFEKASTLLVNSELRKEFDSIHNKIDVEVKKLNDSLCHSLWKKGDSILIYEKYFDCGFLKFISENKVAIFDSAIYHLDSVIYYDVFNEKVLSFLNKKDFKNKIADYIEIYDKLIEETTFLKRDFTLAHFSNVTKGLEDNNFFNAWNKIELSNWESYDSDDSLREKIAEEKDKIMKDEKLQKKFEEINKAISNAELRKFRDLLTLNRDILPKLIDIKKFRKELLFWYLIKHQELVNNVLLEFNPWKIRISEIVDIAKNQSTKWEEVIKTFNDRFKHLPFSLIVENKEDVILKDTAPTIWFVFSRDWESTTLDDKNLLWILSTWEKRAFYILNIIFEVEVRLANNQKTLFIVDDIADSFDYKNKYAIIEYLDYIKNQDIFKLIILTHNFDFYRTLQWRWVVSYNWSIMASKSSDRIAFKKASYLKNPFLAWKNDLNDKSKLIASIPFVRNLVEYTIWTDNDDFINLTSFLHHKWNFNNLKIWDLKEIYERILPWINFPDGYSNLLYKDFISCTLSESSMDSEELNLENKVLLSIYIRLITEEYLKNKILDTEFFSSISSSQTHALIKKYKNKFPNSSNISLIDKVNLITPVNIHLNAFMYEPILDMWNNELVDLYNEVKIKLI